MKRINTAVADAADAQAGDAAQIIEARLGERRCEVATRVDELGCKSPDVRKLVKFHEIRARLNLG